MDSATNVTPVNTIGELFVEEFNAQKNLIHLPRTLRGDFNALAREIWREKSNGSGMLVVDNLDDLMMGMPALSAPAKKALENLWDDIDKLSMINLKTEIRLMEADNMPYWDDHTYTFHADTVSRDKLKTGRTVCCYTGASTEWLQPQDARRIHDTNYEAHPNAHIFALPLGDIWRQACFGTNLIPAPNGAEPLAHRAPKDSGLRLMLITRDLLFPKMP